MRWEIAPDIQDCTCKFRRTLLRQMLREKVAESLSGHSGRFVLYCGGGISATCAAHAMTRLGYANLAIYDGSLEEWSADPTLPLVTL